MPDAGMWLRELVWLDAAVDKLAAKHHATTDEVEQVLANSPHRRRVERGQREGDDLYVAFGQTDGGR